MESELILAIDSIANNIDALAQPRFIDWLAVVLSVFSIAVSGAAILFAVRVADKQNKIALFEKRYAVYDILLHCISFADSIRNDFDLSSMQVLFIISFSYRTIEDRSADTLFKECTKYAMDAKSKLDSASFLFSCDTDIYSNKIISALFDLIYFDSDAETRKKYGEKYKYEVQAMKQELLPKIKAELSLLK